MGGFCLLAAHWPDELLRHLRVGIGWSLCEFFFRHYTDTHLVKCYFKTLLNIHIKTRIQAYSLYMQLVATSGTNPRIPSG